MYKHLLILIFALCALTFSRSAIGTDDKAEFLEVRGNSLAPLVKPGQTIRLLYGYYDNRAVKRGDIVAYNFSGNLAPIIKIVKAIPGDMWQLRKSKGSYLIVVNNRPLKNSEGRLYRIPESDIKMLKLYAKDYPTLPEGVYLILGNQTSGSLDSSRFGLINKIDIIGRVEILKSH